MINVDLQSNSQRILDLLVVILFAPFWIPVLAVCALLVWLDDPRAPVVYRQARVGRHGQVFPMWKLRSMVRDAERIKCDLMEYNERIWPDFKMTGDPRITRVGGWLRKTSLDELPQLLNVIYGHMSLVGPRPTSFSLSTYDIWHTERLEVRPGITGFWQVRSRVSAFDDRVRMDILHVRGGSIGAAMMLLLYSIPAAMRGR